MTCAAAAADTRIPAYNDAATRAFVRVAEATANGLAVDTAIELYAAGDQLCIVSFQVTGTNAVMERDQWCVAQEGAYERRKAGLSAGEVRRARQLITQYPQRGSWSTLVANVFQRGDTFAGIQQLVQRDATFRAMLLERIVGHQVVFVDPVTRRVTLP
jgi:hypothetical protein